MVKLRKVGNAMPVQEQRYVQLAVRHISGFVANLLRKKDGKRKKDTDSGSG